MDVAKVKRVFLDAAHDAEGRLLHYIDEQGNILRPKTYVYGAAIAGFICGTIVSAVLFTVIFHR